MKLQSKKHSEERRDRVKDKDETRVEFRFNEGAEKKDKDFITNTVVSNNYSRDKQGKVIANEMTVTQTIAVIDEQGNISDEVKRITNVYQISYSDILGNASVKELSSREETLTLLDASQDLILVVQATVEFRKQNPDNYSPLQVAAGQIAKSENVTYSVGGAILSFYFPSMPKSLSSGAGIAGALGVTIGRMKAEGMYGILQTNSKGERAIRTYRKTN
jgi:transcriptional regulator with PAS, ATPase and Fis domain